MNVRSARRVDGAYVYTYDLSSVDNANEPVNGCGGALTFGEHWRNQFHNECESLLALRETGLAPRVLEYDPEALVLVVEDVGEPRRLLTVSDLERCLEHYARMHVCVNGSSVSLKDVWHSRVSEEYYFHASADLLAKEPGNSLAPLVDAIPELIALGERLPGRFAKADSGRENVVATGEGVVILDFQTSHSRYQNVDVVELIWSFDPSGERFGFDKWMDCWMRYASCCSKEGSVDELHEFLYLVIRKTFWSLRRPELHPGTAMKKRALRAYRELRNLHTV